MYAKTVTGFVIYVDKYINAYICTYMYVNGKSKVIFQNILKHIWAAVFKAFWQIDTHKLMHIVKAHDLHAWLKNEE